ncbi:glomulin-like isoform X1 [Cimex lectularius]|uniref:Glomulin n=1 Tax=Cimex lectularius TaxID=79782 RepID=A0A8I6RFU5_CIMLE|nr:glomulin-like isoform X1 [Cimex lectularius]
MGSRKTTVNMPDDQKELIENVRQCLEENRVSDAWDLTFGEENKKLVGSCSQELFSVVSKYLNEDSALKNTVVFEYAKDLVRQIADQHEPEETLLELLEFVETADVTGFLIYTDALKTCLHKMPNKRGTSIIWVCNTIVRYLCDMDLPKEIEDEKYDCFLEEDSAEAKNIIKVYNSIINMFEPFVREVETGQFEVKEKHRVEYVETILKFLLKLLGRPLAFMDLETKSYYEISCKIIKFISVYKHDPLHYLSCIDVNCSVYDALSSTTVDADYTNLSLMVFYHMLFKHKLGLNEIAHVYSIEYILENILTMTHDVLTMRNPPTQLKATEMTLKFFERVCDKSLSINNLPFTVVSKFIEVLTHTMVYSDTKTIRQKSVQIYKQFLYKFNSEGRFRLITSLDKTGDPGLVGYGLTILKDFIVETLDKNDSQDLKEFTGTKLKYLLQQFCTMDLNDDLVRNSDRIISTLNLLRFIVIRDQDNITGIAQYIEKLEDDYLTPLKHRIEVMRREHVFEKDGLIKCQERGSESDVKKVLGLTCDVPIDEQIKALDKSFTILDLIDSLRSRLSMFIYSKVNKVEIPIDT